MNEGLLFIFRFTFYDPLQINSADEERRKATYVLRWQVSLCHFISCMSMGSLRRGLALLLLTVQHQNQEAHDEMMNQKEQLPCEMRLTIISNARKMALLVANFNRCLHWVLALWCGNRAMWNGISCSWSDTTADHELRRSSSTRLCYATGARPSQMA